MQRKLTTIFCADVSGYSRMMGADEARTLTTLKEYREAIEGFIARHHGRVVSWSGDGLLSDFASVVEAVQCAAEVQRELQARNAGRDEDQRMTFRIGINLGDVMIDDADIFGEGVNIAARLQQLAVPGGILISSSVYEQVRGKLSMNFASLGMQQVKNIAGEVSVYAVNVDGVTPQKSVNPNARPIDVDEERGERRRRRGEVFPAAGDGRVRRGKLVRRALALLLDYFIVAVACVAVALALNTFIAPTLVRMDLALHVVDYGERVETGEWKTVSEGQDAKGAVKTDERTITYDYLGLFRQSYLQQRTTRNYDKTAEIARAKAEAAKDKIAAEAEKAAAQTEKDVEKAAAEREKAAEQAEAEREKAAAQAEKDRAAGGAPPAAPPSPAIPAQPAVPAPPAPPAPMPPVPTPPAMPAPPEPGHVDAPGVTIDGDHVSVPGAGVDVRPGHVHIGGSHGVDVDSDDDSSWFTADFDFDDDDGVKVHGFSFSNKRLIDPATGSPISRPSLDEISFIVLLIYLALMETGAGRGTFGKRAFDLVTTREDGRPLSFAKALARNAIKVLSLPIFVITAIVALFSRRRQTIHDLLAGTVVVRAD